MSRVGYRLEPTAVANRLDRIEELLEVSLSDGSTLLELHFALRVMRYIDK